MLKQEIKNKMEYYPKELKVGDTVDIYWLGTFKVTGVDDTHYICKNKSLGVFYQSKKWLLSYVLTEDYGELKKGTILINWE